MRLWDVCDSLWRKYVPSTQSSHGLNELHYKSTLSHSTYTKEICIWLVLCCGLIMMWVNLPLLFKVASFALVLTIQLSQCKCKNWKNKKITGKTMSIVSTMHSTSVVSIPWRDASFVTDFSQVLMPWRVSIMLGPSWHVVVGPVITMVAAGLAAATINGPWEMWQ